jgi:ATP-binding cassette, subfamily C, bacterial LapB
MIRQRLLACRGRMVVRYHYIATAVGGALTKTVIKTLATGWATGWATLRCRVQMPSFTRDLLLAGITINLLSLALPIVTLQVYDRVLTWHNASTLGVLVSGAVVAIVLETALRLARAWLMGRAGAEFEHAMGCHTLRHALTVQLGTVEPGSSEAGFTAGGGLQRFDTGAAVQDFGNLAKLRDLYNGQLLTTLVDVPFLLVFLGLVGWLGGWLVLVPLALLVLFTGVAWLAGARLRDAIHARDTVDDRRFGFMIECLQGIHSIKALGLEPLFQRRYEAHQSAADPLNYHVARLNSQSANLASMFGQVMVVAIVTAGAPMIVGGQMSMGTLIACVLLGGRIMQPVQRALSLWMRLQDVAVTKQRLDVFLALPVPVPVTVPPAQQPERLGTLRCEGVCFVPDPAQLPLLQDITLTVQRGEAIALTGAHGAGKSLLLALMAGLATPTAGRVLVDGLDVGRYPSAQRLQHVACLPTHGVIFRGTILENLTGFQPSRAAAVQEIAAHLGIDQAVSRLPYGYETRLDGGDGDGIPPGLKQRIAIARALRDKPRLILFDQADRMLDREGYNYLFRLIGRLKGAATLVLVTEDRNLLRLADRQFELRHGRLEPLLSPEALPRSSLAALPEGISA